MDIVLTEFIEHWKSKDYVIGIVLTGSHALGLQNENSDIDIRIIFDTTQKTTLKGIKNKISYFAESIDSVKKRMQQDYARNMKFEARLFSIGKILYKKNDTVDELIIIAHKFMNTPFRNTQHHRDAIILKMYSLSVNYNYLIQNESSKLYTYNYMSFLKNALHTYSWFMSYELFIDIKTDLILNNPNYRRTNLWQDYPDKTFIQIWIDCIEGEYNNENIRKIYNYLQSQMIQIEGRDFEVVREENIF
ncbi:putative nucleotidyltransferase [Chryseobacterium bernardetii]|uniref:Nucleotidyltransferase-like protein n=3 Tax=Chryseobacterium TaxID=59732 RepID=A0A543ECA2_9FLAO|nr:MULTISPECIES: nucleotidyltransferase domain-containing protein [Chryseobacterium]MDR6372611.1 putative nucleotidyltransferase [Chryseobacterium vietnamense]MDR6442829.1 putative nucleotidyltransferase [Chryseobacterium bernardetii]MDR6460127.1 putative nucleotidyltransferase [Chryseobacterium vietnamense]TQM19195.1 nucleotidyltransferase-like protein [Chryseobacterium aquifrigidense]